MTRLRVGVIVMCGNAGGRNLVLLLAKLKGLLVPLCLNDFFVFEHGNECMLYSTTSLR